MLTVSQRYILSVFAVLVCSTVIVQIWSRLEPGREVLHKVRVIVKSWWIIAVFLLGALLTGFWGVAALFYFSTLYALCEYFKHSRLDFKRSALLMLGLITTAQYLLLVFGIERWFYVLPILASIWGIPIMVVGRGTVKNLPEAFSTMLGMILLGYFLSYVPALLRFHQEVWRPDQPIVAVLMLIFLVEINDVFQFISGKMFGRRKLVPEISPNKTEAGFLGGLGLTTLLGVLILPGALGVSVGGAALLAAVISITGIFGDLLFSATKRYFAIKDFSQVLPGHGGVLDRLDSLILVAPIYFHLVIFIKGVP